MDQDGNGPRRSVAELARVFDANKNGPFLGSVERGNDRTGWNRGTSTGSIHGSTTRTTTGSSPLGTTTGSSIHGLTTRTTTTAHHPTIRHSRIHTSQSNIPPPRPIKPPSLAAPALISHRISSTSFDNPFTDPCTIGSSVESTHVSTSTNVASVASTHSFHQTSTITSTCATVTSKHTLSNSFVKALEELVETERSFLADLHVLIEVYISPCKNSQVLSASEQKLLFGHVDPVVAVSTRLVHRLENAMGSPADIGSVFCDMVPELDTAYCDYCKHIEPALAKLAEYATPACPEHIKAFLEDAKRNLAGKTGAWDLSSLLVKPVQRVLKYTLLLKALLKETPDPHPPSLVTALDKAQTLSDRINTVKLRKDLVEKYVHGKGPQNIMHGITKKLGRSAQQLKVKTGLSDECTTDEVYDALVDKFERQYELVRKFENDLVDWLKSVKRYIQYEETMAMCFEDVYTMERTHPASARYTGSDTIDYFQLVKKYRTACARLMGTYQSAESHVKTQMLPSIKDLFARFKEVKTVMVKRDAKLLDYDRVAALRAKGDPIDKHLSDSAAAYEPINAQLLEDLPTFTGLVPKVMHALMAHVMMLQIRTYNEIRGTVNDVADALGISVYETTDDILGRFKAHLRIGGPIEQRCRQIPTLQRWHHATWYQDTSADGPSDTAHSPQRRKGRSNTNSMLIDLTGSTPAPRSLRADTDAQAAVRQTIMFSSTPLIPSPLHPPPLTASLSSLSLYNNQHGGGGKVGTSGGSGSVGSQRGGDVHTLPRTASSHPNLTSGGETIPHGAVPLLSLFPAHNTSSQPISSTISVADVVPDTAYTTHHHTRQLTAANSHTDTSSYAQVDDPFTAVSMYAFTAELDDEVSLSEGSVVTVYAVQGRRDADDYEWWYGMESVSGLVGWFPRSFVEVRNV